MFALLPTQALPHRSCPECTLKFGIRTSSRKRPRAANAQHHAQPSDDAGSSEVQNKLLDVIRVQIGQVKVKDFVKEESEKLRQAAEEVSVVQGMQGIANTSFLYHLACPDKV